MTHATAEAARGYLWRKSGAAQSDGGSDETRRGAGPVAIVG